MNLIAEKASKGLKLDELLILDSHCHIGCWFNFNIPENTAQGMMKSMDRTGINKVFISAHSSIGPDYQFGNNLVIDVLNRYPERFMGYVTVNPNYPEDMNNELERCFKNNGIRGIKLHPYMHGCRCDNTNYSAAYEAADGRKCPVLIHTSGVDDVVAIDKLAANYKNAIFIIGHGGADIRGMKMAVEVVNRHENVFVDTAVSLAFEGNIEWFVKEMGDTKILFGSDMPFYDPRPTLGRIVYADISDDAKRAILGLNLVKILGKGNCSKKYQLYYI